MQHYFNPLDKNCKSVSGGVEKNHPIVFCVYSDAEKISLVLRKDGESPKSFSMMKQKGFFTCTVTVENAGLYWYYFSFGNGYYLSATDNLTAKYSREMNSYQLTVFEKNVTPDWLKGGVMYQIFPDRFFKKGSVPVKKGRVLHENADETPVFLPNEQGEITNNDFFGGNLKGITEKLDYLSSLGVTCIYLNPIFEAYSNHRYDTGDYMKIDEMLGTEEDFKILLEKANQKGIKIILDGVFNHTGSDSVYFNKEKTYGDGGAYNDKNSPYYKWYNFTSYPDKYESWWGIKTLPDVNENEKSYVDFITGKNGVIEKYTNLGIGGWRLDVADELPGSFIQKIRKTVKKCNKNAVVIGEVWEDATNKVSYGQRRKYFQGKELDGVMNYPLKEAIISYVTKGNGYKFSDFIKTQVEHYPKQNLDVCMNILGTHDTERILTVLGKRPNTEEKTVLANYKLTDSDYKIAREKLKMASLLQFTCPGVPCIYYGDEAGMQGFKDPLNRRFYPWNNFDKELVNWYKLLGKIRKLSPFSGGEFIEVFADKNAYVFKRKNGDDEILIAVNNSEKQFTLNFSGSLYELLTNKKVKDTVTLDKNGMLVLYSDKI